MKKYLFLLLMPVLLLGCSTQEVVSSWVNPNVKHNGPYKSVFLMAITHNQAAKNTLEDKMAAQLEKQGIKSIKSHDVMPASMFGNQPASKEDLKKIISQSGCDAVFTMSLVRVEKELNYQPGTVYAPMGFYGYYGYWGSMMIDPGYYTVDKVYTVESNFYDFATDQLLWSIRSKSYTAPDLDSWFGDYAFMMHNELVKLGLLKGTK